MILAEYPKYFYLACIFSISIFTLLPITSLTESSTELYFNQILSLKIIIVPKNREVYRKQNLKII